MRASAKSRYTFEDYLAMPEDNARRHEVIDGQLFVTPTPLVRHQHVVSNIARLLGALTIPRGLGEPVVGGVTVRLADDTVLEPDLVFIRTDRLDIIDPERGLLAPPDLVVEVLSPSNRSYDRNLKRKRYLEFGVPELWLVDTDASTIEVWRSGDTAPRLASDTLAWSVGAETFEIALADVSRELGAKGR
jgi:Uma2 family endonuclease